jgi:diguanylate cyclase (GGDEF)-like protein
MFNVSFIAFRIPFLVTLISIVMAGVLGYVTTAKMAAGYETVEAEGCKAAVFGIRPLITEKAAAGDCDRIKTALDGLVNESLVTEASVVITDLELKCNHTSGKAVLLDSRQSLPLYDANDVKIGEISVAYSLDALFASSMDGYYKIFAVATGIYFMLLFFIMRSLVKNLSPLHEISKEMDAFNPEDPQDSVFVKNGNDEVSLVARSAGKMFDSLVSFAKRIHASNNSAIHSESHLKEAQRMAKIGSWEYNFEDEHFTMSTEMYRILSMNTKNKNVTWEQFLAFVSDDDREYVNQVIEDAIIHGSKFHMGYQLKTANGDLIEVHTYGKVRKKADGMIRVTGVTRDVTEQNRTQQMIEKLAYFDVLTNLPNRALLKDRLNKAVETAKRAHGKVAVLFLDLDHFKLINDTLGHHVGDKLLIYVAETLNKQLRGSDTISRIGGDEFVVLLPQVKDAGDAELVAEKLLGALEGQHVIDRHTLFVSTSIGIALYPDHAEEVSELVKHADTAMYEAKQKGRNNWQTYNEEMGGQQYGQMLLEEELYEAVKGKTSFEVYYQPQIDTHARKTCALEALIRWNHPEQGLLEPDQFIPLMESGGMIMDMGYWMLDAVASQIAQWQSNGRTLYPVFINLSARQLQDNTLFEKVSTAITTYGIDPKWLGFEIAEGILVSNVEEYTSILQRLHGLGVSLAVDDYGSSYSSIPVISQFPLDYLKIDQRITAELIEDEKEVRNVSAMLMMAHTLGLKTVLEGVEEQEQFDLLQDVPFDVVQGFLYSKPLKVEALELFLDEYNS